MYQFNKSFVKNSQGLILLEAVVALAVLVIILTSMSIVIIVAINNSAFIKNQNSASKYALQSIEYLRYIRNNNYSQFQVWFNAPGLYCMGDNNVITSVAVGGTCTVNTDNKFIRQIEFENNSLDCKPTSGPYQLKATVSVFWSGTKCPNTSTQSRFCHKSKLISCIEQKTASNL